jgi:O-antigen/teichoic acid export membrane protein
MPPPEQQISTYSRLDSIVRVVRTAGALAGAQVATGLAFLLLARRLPRPTFGAFATLYAASVGLSMLLDFGSSMNWTRQLARLGDIAAFRSWLARRSFLQSLACIFLALVVWQSGLFPGLPRFAAMILFMQSLTATVASGALASVRAFRTPALASTHLAVGNTAFLAFVLFNPAHSLVLSASIGATVSWLLSSTLAMYATRSVATADLIPRLRNPWAGASGFGWFGVAIALQSFDLLVITHVAGQAQAARLAAVSRWIQPILLLPAGYVASIFPVLAGASSDEDARMRGRSGRWVVAGVAAICLLVTVAAPAAIRILIGPAYADSVGLLRLLAMWCVVVAANQPLIVFLQARGQQRFLALATLSLVITGLCCTYFLSVRIGAAASPVVATGVSAFLYIAMRVKMKRLRQGSTPNLPILSLDEEIHVA